MKVSFESLGSQEVRKAKISQIDQSQKDRGHTEGYESPPFPPPPPTPAFAKTLYNPHQYNIKGIGVNNFIELNAILESLENGL